MSIYTVHEPPLRKRETAPDPERFVFVRDGFYFWAFVLGPIWMLWRRLWLVLFLYIVAMAIMEVGLWYVQAGGIAHAAAGFLVSLLVGIEAGTLWRWTLARRGWKTLGVVVGNNREAAERRFFSAWVDDNGSRTASPANVTSATPSVPRMPGRSTDVIGLFPEPGVNR